MKIHGVLINPFNQTVEWTTVEQGSLRDIYDAIDCECFDIASLPNGEAIYVDDEGLFEGHCVGDDGLKYGFAIGNHTLFGKGLILGTDASGESIDSKIRLADLESIMFFRTKQK